MTRKNRMLAFLALCACITDIFSTTSFDKDFYHLMKKWQMPGASVAIIKNGQVIYDKGFGYANIATHEPVTPHSLFRIASLSKTITSATVLHLADQHQINLNEPIYQLLNNLHPLPNKKANPETQTITVRNLLNMATGWDGFLLSSFDPMFGPWPQLYLRNIGMTPPLSCYNAARLMTSIAMAHHPNQKFTYSNVNFCLLGLAISKVTHQDYARQSYVDYVQKNILNPLGIFDMQLASSDPIARQRNEVHYYADKHQPFWKPSYAYNFQDLPYGTDAILYHNYADGGWLATATDLAKFASGLYHHQIISAAAFHSMETAPTPHQNDRPHHFNSVGIPYYPWPYGMGFFLVKYHGKKLLFAHGSFTGTNGVLLIREDGTIYSALFNKKPTGVFALTRFRKELMNLFLSKMA